MLEVAPYHPVPYRSEREALASVPSWQHAGWAVVSVRYLPERGEQPWILWLRPVARDGAALAALQAGASAPEEVA